MRSHACAAIAAARWSRRWKSTRAGKARWMASVPMRDSPGTSGGGSVLRPCEANHLTGPKVAAGETLRESTVADVCEIRVHHLEHLNAFHSELQCVRIARKHLDWYAKDRPENTAFRDVVKRVENAQDQLRLTREYFANLQQRRLAA